MPLRDLRERPRPGGRPFKGVIVNRRRAGRRAVQRNAKLRLGDRATGVPRAGAIRFNDRSADNDSHAWEPEFVFAIPAPLAVSQSRLHSLPFNSMAGDHLSIAPNFDVA